MRRTWTLVLILALAGGLASWFFLPANTALAVTVVAVVAAVTALDIRRK